MAGPFGRILHKPCCCDGNPCCPGRCHPYVNEEFPGDCPGEPSDNPLPLSLDCTLTVSTVKNDPITGVPSGCYSVSGTLSYSPSTETWIGVVTGSCTGWCGGTTRIFEYEVIVSCGINPDGAISWQVEVRDNLSGSASRVCVIPTSPLIWGEMTATCDPILLTGTTVAFDCTDLACVIPALSIDEFFGEVIFDVVVSEAP